MLWHLVVESDGAQLASERARRRLKRSQATLSPLNFELAKPRDLPPAITKFNFH